MPPTELSDRVRLQARRIIESRSAALSGLYDLTAVRLFRYASSITRHAQDAEDAVQSALVQVADRPWMIVDSDQPWPYLLRMVRNESLMIVRKRRRWALLTSISDRLIGRGDDSLDRHETEDQVWRALSELPPEQSEPVVLKIWEDLTFAQIGEMLEIPAATAASRYRYAITKLQQKLQHVAPEHLSC
ncbi:MULTISPECIES: RNA polymerase sigma factor [Crateriforma]|uniref:ECF RNA polymerase sigma factor SigL n=1 Tax=Crateriforma conspicua TaxID=2527996 RepID=A0A5C5Y4J6_9PLAN|nr:MULTISPECIES: sigma-70 family RNA polymerase sigma factor [Crateriforma]QDV64169.1 ECF RNA polymerase sigma factor SigL [Crateriforma conspicua]TWT69561.1 ECF RNA polymerase sigma factor SigL [Crateriforma conspicua]